MWLRISIVAVALACDLFGLVMIVWGIRAIRSSRAAIDRRRIADGTPAKQTGAAMMVWGAFLVLFSTMLWNVLAKI